MNNYFGIGLDAKISLDFNNKRDEHPEKCRYKLTVHTHSQVSINLLIDFYISRSRTKNMMWYGVLGTKELLHRTYKNLEQRVLLEVRTEPGPGGTFNYRSPLQNTNDHLFSMCSSPVLHLFFTQLFYF